LHRRKKIRKTDAVQLDRPLSSSIRPLPRQRPAGPRRRRAAVGLSLGLLVGLCLAACVTEFAGRKRFLKGIVPPQPVLTATAAFGNGALAVQAWLGPSVRLRKSDEAPKVPGERPHGEPRWSHAAEYGGESDTPFEQGSATFSREEVDEMYGNNNYQYMRPPRLALTFTFTNTGSEPVTFVIADVNSALGNFASRPEKFTLAPGQQGSPDPMLSPFENNFDGLDVTLILKQGSRRETHVLPLRRAPGAPPPRAANPGSH
jgi:hypothetical protein